MTPELVLDLATRVAVKHSALRDFPRDMLVFTVNDSAQRLLALGAVSALVMLGGVSGSAATPRTPRLTSGQERIFPARALRVGSAVSCTSHAIRITARIPAAGRGVAKIADGPRGSAIIELTARADGRIVARCR